MDERCDNVTINCLEDVDGERKQMRLECDLKQNPAHFSNKAYCSRNLN